ncbi:phospho-N-acetylmuramoyl-pentapeptide-transferase [Verrucomicrobiota bacterium]
MLYYLHLLQDWFSPMRVFRYITVRSVCGAGTAFLVSLVLGPWVIRKLRILSVGQTVRKGEAPPLYVLHAKKEGTPTMGGILIIASITLSTIMWADPGSLLVWLSIATLCYMGLVGFWDDYLKVFRRRSAAGMRAWEKLVLQAVWAAAVATVLLTNPATAEKTRNLMVPFLKEPVIPDLGVVCTLLFVSLVLIGASNAVNLTDGLDGLAIGCSGSVAFAYLIMSYAAGHADFADYLRIPYVRGCGELAVFCGCMLGACLGFLWYNCHPASVFMGDTGSLALGGALAMVAILIKQELALVIVGGVFVIEAASVILQVASFKSRGKRIFAMAPIHHHFEMKKWSETQVTVRFWILSLIFALFGILTLKLR